MADEIIPAPDLAAFERDIERLVAERIAKGELCLISSLGISLGPQLRLVRAATGLSLAEYIRKKLDDKFELSEVKPNTVAVWPKGKADEQVIAKFNKRVSQERPRSRRFFPWFWQAFASPLEEGRRFYDPSDHVLRSADAPAEADWIEIPPDSIRKPEEAFSVKEVQSRITAWLERVGLSPEPFLEPLPDQDEISISTPTVLDALIRALDKKQLQSLSLPMDIVATLAQRRL